MTTARHARPALACLVFLGALCTQSVQAAPSERATLCKGTPPARQDEMIVVDSAFRRMPDKTLRLGSLDFSSSRHVDGQFFIVAPLGARPASNLDGAQFHAAIDSLAKCGDKTVFGLSFDFDDSTLPPGAFSKPMAIFKEGAGQDDASLVASTATVAGSIKRAWLSAELGPARASPAGTLELRLTNTGNLPSPPLMFAPLADTMTIFHAGTNACQGRTLGANETCRIDIGPLDPAAQDEQFEWPIDVGPHTGVTLRFERHGATLGVAAQNR